MAGKYNLFGFFAGFEKLQRHEEKRRRKEDTHLLV